MIFDGSFFSKRRKEIGIISVIVIIISSFGLFFYQQNLTEQNVKNSIFTQYKDRQIESTQLLAENISSDIQLLMSILQGIADSSFLQKGVLSGDTINKIMQEKFLQINNITKIDGIFIADKEDIVTYELDSQGIPNTLKRLLEIRKKREVIKYCKSITLSEDDLVLLMYNCKKIGFSWRSKFKEFVPKHLKITDCEVDELKQEKPQKLRKKVKSIFEERKKVCIHLFEKGSEWHCFYYSDKDMETGETSHFILGPHLHYISHLWTGYKKQQVWEAFDKRKIEFEGVHIKLNPSEPVIEYSYL